MGLWQSTEIVNTDVNNNDNNTTTKVIVTPETLPPTFQRANLDQYDAILFDLDGCLWHQYRFLPNITKPTLETLNELNKKVFFCTNNAAAHHDDMITYFAKNGYTTTFPTKANPNVPQQLYCAGNTAAKWILDVFAKQQHNKQQQNQEEEESAKAYDFETSNSNDKILLCGEPGLFQEFYDAGFAKENIIDVATLADTVQDKMGLLTFKVDLNVRCVVMGFSRNLSYVQCAILGMYCHELNVPLISTNPDDAFSVPLPTGCNRVLPEIGSFVKQVEATTGVKALATCGKPNTIMFEQIVKDNNLTDKSRILMVGDNLRTDIQFGINCGIDTLLVLSGVTHPSIITKNDEKIVNDTLSAAHNLMTSTQIIPTYIADDISALIGGVNNNNTTQNGSTVDNNSKIAQELPDVDMEKELVAEQQQPEEQEQQIEVELQQQPEVLPIVEEVTVEAQ